MLQAILVSNTDHCLVKDLPQKYIIQTYAGEDLL